MASPARIDRRANERRTQDLLGQPFECVRFRDDLGPLSRWVARHRLDKIPFLLNVISQEMTLVGPKPEMEQLVLRWKGLVPDYARRFSVMPGVTGLAQVAGADDRDLDGVVRRVHYDLYYIDNRSIVLDIRTLARTIGLVTRSTSDPMGMEAWPLPADGPSLAPTLRTNAGGSDGRHRAIERDGSFARERASGMGSQDGALADAPRDESAPDNESSPTAAPPGSGAARRSHPVAKGVSR